MNITIAQNEYAIKNLKSGKFEKPLPTQHKTDNPYSFQWYDVPWFILRNKKRQACVEYCEKSKRYYLWINGKKQSDYSVHSSVHTADRFAEAIEIILEKVRDNAEDFGYVVIQGPYPRNN